MKTPVPGQVVKITLTGRVVQSSAHGYLRLVRANGSYVSFDVATLEDIEVVEEP